MISVFWDSQGTLFIDFLIEQRTINAAYYSSKVSLSFKTKRCQSVKSVCLLHDNARPYTAAATTGTLKETHWEYCHTLPTVLT
jgi:hypothetical protein